MILPVAPSHDDDLLAFHEPHGPGGRNVEFNTFRGELRVPVTEHGDVAIEVGRDVLHAIDLRSGPSARNGPVGSKDLKRRRWKATVFCSFTASKRPAEQAVVAEVWGSQSEAKRSVNVLRLTQSQRLFVIAHEEAKTLLTNRGQYLFELLETRVGKIVESRQESRFQAFQVEALVGQVDALGVISHAYPERVLRVLDLGHGAPKCIHIAGPRSKVNVPDRDQQNLVGTAS